MPRNRFFHCLTLAAAFFLLWETQASAYETRVVTDHANTPCSNCAFLIRGKSTATSFLRRKEKSPPGS